MSSPGGGGGGRVPILVHIDMKGGPPTLDYLLQLLPMLRSWGATGILVEWEDMFPYSGILKVGTLWCSLQFLKQNYVLTITGTGTG